MNPKNAKRHPRKQVELIAKNIRAFGFTSPLLIDEDNNIIAGHGRHAAALLLGLPQVPAIRLAHLTLPDKRALALADNKLGELGKWDFEILATELQEIAAPSLDISFDPEILGFNLNAVERRRQVRVKREKADRVDQSLSFDRPGEPITRPGDLWICGEHRLLCAPPSEEAAYANLLCGHGAHLVFSTGCKFTSLTSCKLMASHLNADAVVYISTDPLHLGGILDAVRPVFGNAKDVVALGRASRACFTPPTINRFSCSALGTAGAAAQQVLQCVAREREGRRKSR